MKRITILTPVYNDWECLRQLCIRLNSLAERNSYCLRIIAVNDGSSISMPTDVCVGGTSLCIQSVEVIELHCNLGHQRAIAVGLTEVARRDDQDLIVVMDSDGEDNPDDIAGLIRLHEENPNDIILAQRAKRSEGMPFIMFYWIYRQMFYGLTGYRISFGNFSLIPSRFVHNLIHSPSLWSSLSAAILRSHIPLVLYPTVRAQRFLGTSKMNFTALVLHGLKAISVFGETVIIRLSIIVFTMVLITLSAVLCLRLFTDLLVPGYTSEIIGILFIVVLQVGTMLGGMGLLLLHNNSVMPMIPAIHAKSFIRTIIQLR